MSFAIVSLMLLKLFPIRILEELTLLLLPGRYSRTTCFRQRISTSRRLDHRGPPGTVATVRLPLRRELRYLTVGRSVTLMHMATSKRPDFSLHKVLDSKKMPLPFLSQTYLRNNVFTGHLAEKEIRRMSK